MMDAVTAAHYRVHAVVIGDVRFTKAEHGVQDPVRRRGRGVRHVTDPCQPVGVLAQFVDLSRMIAS